MYYELKRNVVTFKTPHVRGFYHDKFGVVADKRMLENIVYASKDPRLRKDTA